ncbi:hypothetical protein G6O69_08950 [Pseudenhygromyxa sp. WMMC2535]|uniref:hypothetical protein n=1 Tax=Pseudenhygromyxa sp. WMMC2535 TaxID=2712867 RepID=UPI0015950FD7|nr:hypothetical protein [Pseudenhygromyxa sp. WMMC2535]NVB37962.1 hypothetical protein [Pseudenhygromyxa sp. WMMC2535]
MGADTEADTEADGGEPTRIEESADWPETARYLTLVEIEGEAALLLGGDDGLGTFGNANKVMALRGDGEMLWVAMTGNFEVDAIHKLTSIERLDSGNVWLSGWAYDEGIVEDDPGWGWYAELDMQGEWVWFEEVGPGASPQISAPRADGSVVVLSQSWGADQLLGLSSTAMELWSVSGWGDDDDEVREWTRALAVTDTGVMVGGGHELVGQASSSSWFARFSEQGEFLEEFVHAPVAGKSNSGIHELEFDPESETLAALCYDYEPGSDGLTQELLLRRFDASGATLLSTRSIGDGLPLGLKIDGASGAWILWDFEGSGMLGYYPADPEAPPEWEVLLEGLAAYDFAVDVDGKRAYVLTDTSIEIVEF